MIKELPNNLIDLIQIAIDDMRKVKADNRYRICMSVWHEEYKGKCEVCMAGAILAKTFKTPINRTINRYHYGENNAIKFGIIDSIRYGDFGWSFVELDWRIPTINFKNFNLIKGNLSQWNKFLRALKKEQKEYDNKN